jgi:hypothetical protein
LPARASPTAIAVVRDLLQRLFELIKIRVLKIAGFLWRKLQVFRNPLKPGVSEISRANYAQIADKL